ncbi:hypothetical protein D3C71_1293260 [compost metagenome]
MNWSVSAMAWWLALASAGSGRHCWAWARSACWAPLMHCPVTTTTTATAMQRLSQAGQVHQVSAVPPITSAPYKVRSPRAVPPMIKPRPSPVSALRVTPSSSKTTARRSAKWWSAMTASGNSPRLHRCLKASTPSSWSRRTRTVTSASLPKNSNSSLTPLRPANPRSSRSAMTWGLSKV